MSAGNPLGKRECGGLLLHFGYAGEDCLGWASSADLDDMAAIMRSRVLPAARVDGERVYCSPFGFFVRRDQRWVRVTAPSEASALVQS